MCKQIFPNKNSHKKPLDKKEKPKPNIAINVCLLDLLTIVDEITVEGIV
jgi:hypothetical protein